MENQLKTTETIINFVVIVSNTSKDVIGNLFYNTFDRTWSFKYSEDFKTSKYLPIMNLSDVEKIYEHNEVVNWLSHRVSEQTKLGDFTIKVREYVKSKINTNVSYLIEIHHVQ